MAGRRSVDVALLLIAAAALFAGTWHLMAMRFSTGDVYPPYSSLRTDPLGSKALYDTLEYLDPDQVQRHYSKMSRIDPGPADTVFVLGLQPWSLDLMEEEFARLAAGGARVVVAVRSYSRPDKDQEKGRYRDSKSGKGEKKSSEETERSTGDKEKETAGDGPPDDREKRALEHPPRDLRIKESGARPDEKGRYTAVLTLNSADLPAQISLVSPVYFDSYSGRWETIYTLEDQPVFLQRSIGQGSIVLLSDPFPLSNEALRWDMYPRLISWLLAGTGKVIFVESHLGVRETQGVMTLLRKYRLTALLSAFALIALLSVWKNAVPMTPIPDPADQGSGYVVSEKDQFTGLVSLLKRNIGADRIIQLCIREAERGRQGAWAKDRMDEAALKGNCESEGREKDPVLAYNRITRKLSERINR